MNQGHEAKEFVFGEVLKDVNRQDGTVVPVILEELEDVSNADGQSVACCHADLLLAGIDTFDMAESRFSKESDELPSATPEVQDRQVPRGPCEKWQI